MEELLALAPAGIPRAADVSLDSRVLAVTSLLVIGTGILFGLAPVPQLFRRDLQLKMKEGFRLVLVGLAIGTAGALALTRLITSLIHGVSTTDPRATPSGRSSSQRLRCARAICRLAGRPGSIPWSSSDTSGEQHATTPGFCRGLRYDARPPVRQSFGDGFEVLRCAVRCR